MRPDQTVLIACVHYRDQRRVEAFVAHVANDLTFPSGWAIEVVICDNSLDWNSRASVCRADVVHPPGNLGYLNGIAYALHAWAEDSGCVPDWLLICNTDIQLDSEFLSRLVEIDPGADTGIVAPRVLGIDNRDQNPFQATKPPRLRVALDLFWSLSSHTAALNRGLHRVLDPMASQWRRSRGNTESVAMPLDPFDIYAPHGCCMAVHRNLLRHDDALLLPGFLYGEEEHLADAAASRGLRVVMVPNLCVVHTQVGSMKHTTSARQRRRWYRQAKLHTLRSHY